MDNLEEKVEKVIKYCRNLVDYQPEPVVGIDLCAAVRKQVALEVLILLDSADRDVTNSKVENTLS